MVVQVEVEVEVRERLERLDAFELSLVVLRLVPSPSLASRVLFALVDKDFLALSELSESKMALFLLLDGFLMLATDFWSEHFLMACLDPTELVLIVLSLTA